MPFPATNRQPKQNGDRLLGTVGGFSFSESQMFDKQKYLNDLHSELLRVAKELGERLSKKDLKVSTGKTGNQWFTIPEPPKK